MLGPNGLVTMPPEKSRPQIDGFIRLIISLYLAPVPLEITFGFARRDQYDYRRVLILFATATVLSVVLLVLRNRKRFYGQYVVGFWLIMIGILLAAVGAVLTLRGADLLPGGRWLNDVDIVLEAIGPTIGLLLAISGIYLVVDRRRRAKREYDRPLPDDIANTRVRPINQRLTGATWLAPGFKDERLVELARGYLNDVDLHFVAFFDHDATCQFYVDVLDDEAMPSTRADANDRRAHYVRDSMHVRYLIGQLDKRLADLHTGKLVRVVLDVEQGAIFFYNLGALGFLVGVTLDQQQVDPTDWKMSHLANDVLRAHGRKEDDDFYRLCPRCGATNRDKAPTKPTVVPLQPRNGHAS
jgi:hypothetical protein